MNSAAAGLRFGRSAASAAGQAAQHTHTSFHICELENWDLHEVRSPEAEKNHATKHSAVRVLDQLRHHHMDVRQPRDREPPRT